MIFLLNRRAVYLHFEHVIGTNDPPPEQKSDIFVPIYFDISSHEDVPYFLSEYRCYSLPSHLHDLCSALRPEENVYDRIAMCNTSTGMMQDINILKRTIEIMGRNHEGYARCKHAEF